MKNKLLKISSQRNLFFKPNQNTFKIPKPPLKYIKQIQSTRNLKLNQINYSIKINKNIFDSEKNKMFEIGKNNEIINYDYYEEKKSLNKNYKRNYLYENYNQKFETEKKILPLTTLPNINRINITNNNNNNNNISNNNNIEENLKNTNKIINVKKIQINNFKKQIFLPNLNFEIK